MWCEFKENYIIPTDKIETYTPKIDIVWLDPKSKTVKSITIDWLTYSKIEVSSPVRCWLEGPLELKINDNEWKEVWIISWLSLTYRNTKTWKEVYLRNILKNSVIEVLNWPDISEQNKVTEIFSKLDKDKIGFFINEKYSDDFNYIFTNWSKITDEQVKEFKDALKVYLKETRNIDLQDFWLQANIKFSWKPWFWLILNDWKELLPNWLNPITAWEWNEKEKIKETVDLILSKLEKNWNDFFDKKEFADDFYYIHKNWWQIDFEQQNIFKWYVKIAIEKAINKIIPDTFDFYPASWEAGKIFQINVNNIPSKSGYVSAWQD